MTSDESQPLLNSDHIAGEAPRYERFSWLLNGVNGTYVHTSRTKAQRFLTSKAGHYAVILLVSADVLCIIADFVINLFICERQCGQLSGDLRGLVTAHDALGIVSLIFSSLFMAELIASTWAFGIKYVNSTGYPSNRRLLTGSCQLLPFEVSLPRRCCHYSSFRPGCVSTGCD